MVGGASGLGPDPSAAMVAGAVVVLRAMTAVMNHVVLHSSLGGRDPETITDLQEMRRPGSRELEAISRKSLVKRSSSPSQ